MAATLAIGEGAVLSRLSLAALHQTWRHRVPMHDVLVPRRHRPVAGINLHTCRRLDPRDVTVYRGIPVTTVARMLVDVTGLSWARLQSDRHPTGDDSEPNGAPELDALDDVLSS